MLCPKCKNKKGQATRVDPVTRRCPKCGASLFVSHTGKRIVRGVAAKPAPQPAEKK